MQKEPCWQMRDGTSGQGLVFLMPADTKRVDDDDFVEKGRGGAPPRRRVR